MIAVYYNENDAGAAAWLRELMIEGMIPAGDVDERSIEEVTPADVTGYMQCHFFAGIGGWPYALRLAQWPEHLPVWTGSCPCQPFSTAGARTGFADQRHLWPAWYHLIEQCRPQRIFGEQVAKRGGLAWLDVVRTDLEYCDYRIGSAVLAAAGAGAPHIRERLYWVAEGKHAWELADRSSSRLAKLGARAQGEQPAAERGGAALDCRYCDGSGWFYSTPELGPCGCGLGDAGSDRGWREPGELHGAQGQIRERSGAIAHQPGVPVEACELGDASGEGWQQRTQSNLQPQAGQQAQGWADPERHGGWSDPSWVWCRDTKWRPVEPGTFPLAYGLPGRVGLLRGYGNAIVPQVAATFIQAYCSLRTLT